MGFVLVGAVIAFLSWRWVFVLLGLTEAGLVVPLWRLHEPHRRAIDPTQEGKDRADEVGTLLRQAGIDADHDTTAPPIGEASLVDVVAYVLRVRTNAIVILASSVGYFFLADLRVFAVIFAIDQYHVSHVDASFLVPVVGLGALAGTVAGGHLGDYLLRRAASRPGSW